MKAVWVAVVLAALTWVAPAMAQTPTTKIQCWTDKSGQRMCGDRVPPEYAGQRREVIKDGRVVDTVSASKTPEEIAAAKRAKEKEEEQKKQAEYDRALLESYRSTEDIVQMRDERLALIDSRTQAAEKNAADTDKVLTSLRTRAEQLATDGKPPDVRLNKQIKQFEKSQKQSQQALERYRVERETLQTKFDKDLARYSELRGLPMPTAKPAATTPATPAAPAAPKTGTAATPATPAAPAAQKKGG